MMGNKQYFGERKMNNTAKKLKRISNTTEFKILMNEIIDVNQKLEETRKIVDSYAVPLFCSMGFVNDISKRTSKGKKLTHPHQAYQSENKVLLKEYYEKVESIHKEHGFDVKYMECPIRKIESQKNMLENKLIVFMNINFDTPEHPTMEERDKIIEICTKCVA